MLSATPPIPGLALSVLIAVALASTPSRGVAQPSIASVAQPSRPLALRPSWALAVSDPPPVPVLVVYGPPTEEGLRLRRAERRADTGWFLVGFGTGLAAGAAPLGARMGRPGYCYADHVPSYVRTARISAGVVGGIGVALALTGGGLVLAVPRADRHGSARPRRTRALRAGLATAGLVSGFALGVATVFFSSLSEAVGCWNS